MEETLRRLNSATNKLTPNPAFLLGVRDGGMAPSVVSKTSSANMYHYEHDDDGLTESASMLTVPLSRATSVHDLELARSRSSQSDLTSTDGQSRDGLVPLTPRERSSSAGSVLVLQDLPHLHRLICNCGILEPETCPKIQRLKTDEKAL